MTFFISCLLPVFSTFTPSFAMTRSEKSSKLGDQGMVVDSYVEETQGKPDVIYLRDPYAFDCETNVVDSTALDEYHKYYEILESVELILPEGRAAWNPLEGVVDFYGYMLACGVILTIQPYIVKFLCDAKISLVQLEPNGYWQLLSLWSLWSANNEPTSSSREVKHIFVLKGSNRGTYFLTSVEAEKLLSQGTDPKLKASDIEVGTTSDKKGVLCGFPISNKFWKNNWFYVAGNWGREVTKDSVTGHPVGVTSCHFMKNFTWMNDSQDLWDDEVHRVVRMVTHPLSERSASVLFAESTLLERRIISRRPDDRP